MASWGGAPDPNRRADRYDAQANESLENLYASMRNDLGFVYRDEREQAWLFSTVHQYLVSAWRLGRSSGHAGDAKWFDEIKTVDTRHPLFRAPKDDK